MANFQDITFEIHDYWSQQFHISKVQPRRIAGSAPNLWAIATNKRVYRLVSGVWDQVTGIEGVISISVGTDVVVVVRDDGQVWMFDPSAAAATWKELPGVPLVQVSAASKSLMVGRNKDSDVYYWDGLVFRPLMIVVADKHPVVMPQIFSPVKTPVVMQIATSFNAKQFKMVDVSIAQDGTIVGVTHTNEVFRWDGISWQIIKGKSLASVHVASRTQIVGIDQKLQAWQYIGRGEWKQLRINCCKQLQITPAGIYWGLVFNTNPTPQDMIVESLLPVYIFRGYPADPSIDATYANAAHCSSLQQ